MRQNTNEILAENARRCAILRHTAQCLAATAAASPPPQLPPMLLSG